MGKKDEFTPTKQTSIDLERALLGLKQKKAGLVSKKLASQFRLGEIKDSDINPRTSIGLNMASEKAKIKKTLSNIEIEIKEVNNESTNKRMLLIEVDGYLRTRKDNNDTIEQLVKLKEQYSSFGSDHTRVASMRLMANKFADQLTAIINS